MVAEKKIQAETIKYATSRRVRHIRMYFGPGIQTGWPDVLFLIPGGYPCFIEFKASGKWPSNKQWRMLLRLRDDDYNAWWVDNLETAKRMIDLAIAGKDIRDADRG